MICRTRMLSCSLKPSPRVGHGPLFWLRLPFPKPAGWWYQRASFSCSSTLHHRGELWCCSNLTLTAFFVCIGDHTRTHTHTLWHIWKGHYRTHMQVNMHSGCLVVTERAEGHRGSDFSRTPILLAPVTSVTV